MSSENSSTTASSSSSPSEGGCDHFPVTNIELAGNSNVQEYREIMAQIQVLQQGLLNINAPYLAQMRDNSSSSGSGIKGKNNTRKCRKHELSGTDRWNAQIISSYIRETIWPSNKILPGLWSKWIENERSLSQQIMKKITIPQGMSGKEYWENFLVGIANDKFCSLRSNLKQGMFVQYEGKFGSNTAIATRHGIQNLYLLVEFKLFHRSQYASCAC